MISVYIALHHFVYLACIFQCSITLRKLAFFWSLFLSCFWFLQLIKFYFDCWFCVALFFCHDYLLFCFALQFLDLLLLHHFCFFLFLRFNHVRFRDQLLCSWCLSKWDFLWSSWTTDSCVITSVAVFLDILASSFCPDRFLILLSPTFLFPLCE